LATEGVLAAIQEVTVIVLPAGAKTYYLSPNGLDTNAGTFSLPWYSLNRAVSGNTALAAGDLILIRGGEYNYAKSQYVNIKNGTSSKNIKIYGYPHESPVIKLKVGAPKIDVRSNYVELKDFEINGLETITSWTSLGNGIYSKAIACESPTNMVTINGVNTPMGRFPKANAANSGYFTVDSHIATTSITDSDLPLPIVRNWTGAELLLRDYSWSIMRTVITSHVDHTLTYTAYPGAAGITAPSDGETQYFIQNHINCLTELGDWYYDGSTFYMYFGANDPNNYVVKVATVDVPLYVQSLSATTINRLTVNGSNLCSIQLDGGNRNTIKDTRINFSGKRAVENIGGTSMYPSIIKNVISDSNNGGIFLDSSTNNVLVSGNTITNTGLFPGMGSKLLRNCTSVGIWMYHVHGANICYNNVINTGYNGITFDGFDISIDKNYIDTYCSTFDDGAGIYTWDDDDHVPQPIANPRYVRDNIIMNGIGAPQGDGANGIYMDDGTDNVIISGNTIAYCKGTGLFVHHDTRINAHHNTFYNVASSTDVAYWGIDIVSQIPTEPIRNCEINNNIVFSTINRKAVMYMSNNNVPVEVTLFGNMNNNYYCFPLNNSPQFYVTNWSNLFLTQSFAQWKTYSGKDLNSVLAPTGIIATNPVVFKYNNTKTTTAYALDGTYKDARGNTYVNTITLTPYTSAILMKL